MKLNAPITKIRHRSHSSRLGMQGCNVSWSRVLRENFSYYKPRTEVSGKVKFRALESTESTT